MARIKDILGRRFGRLLVTGFAGLTTDGKSLARWHCQCDCGNTRIVSGHNLRSHKSLSCGCKLRDRLNAQGTHNHCKRTDVSRTWAAWRSMKRRCTEGHKSHKYYYDRGITVCDRWLEFENFLADMGECPVEMTLDRVDNDVGYTPENCRWATKKQQGSNRRCVAMYTYMGDTKSLTDWASDPRCAVPVSTLYKRVLDYKVPFVEALTKPKGSKLS